MSKTVLAKAKMAELRALVLGILKCCIGSKASSTDPSEPDWQSD